MDHTLSDLFALDMSVWEKVIRTVGVYVVLLVLIRTFGKRLMAQMNSQDLVVVLLLSNVVQNAIIGDDNTLIGGTIGAFVLVIANWGLDAISARIPWFNRILNGVPIPLVTEGTPDLQALRRLSITRHELDTVLRTQGAGSVTEVREAVIDPGGSVLVDILPKDQVVSKADLAQALTSLRDHIDARLDGAR